MTGKHQHRVDTLDIFHYFVFWDEWALLKKLNVNIFSDPICSAALIRVCVQRGTRGLAGRKREVTSWLPHVTATAEALSACFPSRGSWTRQSSAPTLRPIHRTGVTSPSHPALELHSVSQSQKHTAVRTCCWPSTKEEAALEGHKTQSLKTVKASHPQPTGWPALAPGSTSPRGFVCMLQLPW